MSRLCLVCSWAAWAAKWFKLQQASSWVVFWLLCGPVFNMFCWTFWFGWVEQRLRTSVVSFFVLLLGYSVGITNDRWLWPKLMIWDSYELGWQTNELCAFFWNEIRMVWSCKGLQQDFAEIRKVSAFLTYACMEIKRKLFFNPPSLLLLHYGPNNWKY